MLNATDKEGKLRYPEPDVKPLLAEFETQLEASKPKIELNKAALNVGKMSDFDLRGDALRFEAPRVARSSWSSKRQAYAAMGQSPNPVINVVGDTLGNVEDLLSFIAQPSPTTGTHLALGTGQTALNIGAGAAARYAPLPATQRAALVGKLYSWSNNLGKAQMMLGWQGDNIDKALRGESIIPDLKTEPSKVKTDIGTKFKL